MRLAALVLALILVMPCRPAAAQRVKRIALTFDDGPKILKLLCEYDAPSTFFVIGENAESYPELVLAEFEQGHEIGNHTYSHAALKGSGAAEIKKADDVIRGITGVTPSLFRPPEGKLSPALKKELAMMNKTPVLWSVDTRDWAHTDREEIIKNIKENAKDGAIILFHDFISGDSPTPYVLSVVLPYLRERGYVFVTVSELLEPQPDKGVSSSNFIG